MVNGVHSDRNDLLLGYNFHRREMDEVIQVRGRANIDERFHRDREGLREPLQRRFRNAPVILLGRPAKDGLEETGIREFDRRGRRAKGLGEQAQGGIAISGFTPVAWWKALQGGVDFPSAQCFLIEQQAFEAERRRSVLLRLEDWLRKFAHRRVLGKE